MQDYRTYISLRSPTEATNISPKISRGSALVSVQVDGAQALIRVYTSALGEITSGFRNHPGTCLNGTIEHKADFRTEWSSVAAFVRPSKPLLPTANTFTGWHQCYEWDGKLGTYIERVL